MPSKSKIHFAIPSEIAIAIKALQDAVDGLAVIAGHKQKKFTLDGRLVGDIGEVLAAELFEVTLTETQETGFDAHISSGGDKGKLVEVKCRRRSKNIHFKEIPQFLIVLFIEPGDQIVELVYAGPGSVITLIWPNAVPDSNGKLSSKINVSLAKLRGHFNGAKFLDAPPIPLRPGIQATNYP